MKSLFIAAGTIALAQVACATEININFANTAGYEDASAITKMELSRVTKEVGRDVEKALKREDASPARIDITIIDVKANQPTRRQLGMTPGLNPVRTVSVAGMALEGVAYDEKGEVIATYEYSLYERGIHNNHANNQWSDAFRASDRFARRFVEKL